MQYWQNSMAYNLLKNSLFLRFFRIPEVDCYRASLFHKWGTQLLNIILNPLYRAGDIMGKWGWESFLLRNMVFFISLALFVMLFFKAIFGRHFGLKEAFYLVLAFLFLILPLVRRRPEILKGSRFFYFLDWWIKTD